MSGSQDELVEAYLRRLDGELDDLPNAKRREVVEEVADHIAEARAELPVESEAEIRNLLERVGDPDEIAAEARERLDVRQRSGGVREISAIVLLLLGGFLFVVGWFVGLVLLWASDAWTTRDKLIGTFVVPGGLVPLLYALTFSLGAAESCSGELDPQTGAVLSEVCTGGPSLPGRVISALVFIVLLAGPFFTTVYLARRMRRRPAAAC